MQNIKAAVAVFCTACICAELTAQLTGQGWARRSIKAVAGLYILAVVLCVLPQAKGEWKAFALPVASSVELGTQKETVLRAAESQLEETLEAHCREELGAEVAIRIELEETAEGVQVHAENEIETMVKAKGFADCLCFLQSGRADLTVMTSGDALTAAQVAQIRDIVLSKSSVTAQNITIVEVK